MGAVARKITTVSPPLPLDVQPAVIAAENHAASQAGAIAESGGYDGCLIRCRATVEAVNVMPDGLTILLSDGDTQLAAELPRDAATHGAIRRIEPASEVEVTGIVQLGIAAQTVGGLTVSHPALQRLTLLVRRATDIVLVRSPPWWTPRRLAIATGLLAAVALGAIAQVESAERLVEHAGRQLRGTVWSLRAMPDVRRPLPVALGELLHVISREHSIPIRLHADGVQAPIDDTSGRELLLVVQEAVLNAVHHGRPGHVDVTLAATPAGATVTVQDDGTGFEVGRQPGMASGHFGMQGMLERVERLGGTCEVTSTRGAGTTVTARVPLGHDAPRMTRLA